LLEGSSRRSRQNFLPLTTIGPLEMEAGNQRASGFVAHALMGFFSVDAFDVIALEKFSGDPGTMRAPIVEVVVKTFGSHWLDAPRRRE
jgi:hypothetical protein